MKHDIWSIRKIEKVRKIDISEETRIKEKLLIAAHYRVSTKYENQKSSVELQVNYQCIREHTEWIFAGVYIDYGSRCRMKENHGFREMH